MIGASVMKELKVNDEGSTIPLIDVVLPSQLMI